MPIQNALRSLLSCGLAAALALAPWQAHAVDNTALINIVALASQRLAQAEPIAKYKWQKKLPATDAARETQLIADMRRAAPMYGVDADQAEAFFRDQIEASKLLQNARFAQWRLQSPAPVGADALVSARNEINRVSQAMLAGLARIEAISGAPDCTSQLRETVQNWRTRMVTLDSEQAAALDRALQHVCKRGGMSALG
ncbi:chorismate mutase [Chitinasiproducens palmae]|uniref:chorismate mutase n=1 Tax=Chitinasiproducens palmae TaxID=1770053 RepID=A0A1H2PV43_9BURK|nr:chorismate mutase [Chitinasiproducens palmae]SDV51118.1 chorismate mutase [Chitinasiproducens palmae]